MSQVIERGIDGGIDHVIEHAIDHVIDHAIKPQTPNIKIQHRYTPPVNKQTMAEHFSAAAVNYDEYAEVQKQIAKVNIQLLEQRIDCPQDLAIDLGCGTGIHTKDVAALSKQCIAIDISPGMLTSAQKNNFNCTTIENKPIQFCTGDAEALPLKDASVDILHSSMALQWCHSPKQVIDEVKRVLSRTGKAQLAIMLGSSLHELRNAWAQLGIAPRVNSFYGQKEWLASAKSDNEYHVDCQTGCFKEWHTNSLGMLRALKKIGAATKQTESALSEEDAMKPIGKQELADLDRQMLQHQENCTNKPDAAYPLSYDILFISISKVKT